MKKLFIVSVLSLIAGSGLYSCQESKGNTDKVPDSSDTLVQDDEMYRPEFHFSPEENWMNDPNGMFYLNNTYHLFYQYYPEGNVWGPMHWGHATSTDLVKWEEQPIALYPDEKGYIFSGSGVVDTENTSGLGDGITPPVIAMFTYHDPQAEKEGRIDYQTQAIAYSLDEGKTFTKYTGNPVLKNPGIKDFRDPKMTWDQARKQWLMVLSADDQTMIYSSKNLLDWELLSEFGRGFAAHGGVWECPDFFPMKVEGTAEEKWVLIQSLGPGGYNGGSGTQYFVGDFDGEVFVPDASMADLGERHSYWIDFGMDNYAGVTWANIPEEDGRTLLMGWMSNWNYAKLVPTEKWRGANTIPRELTLHHMGGTYRLFSAPVEELSRYFSKSYENLIVEVQERTRLSPPNSDLSAAAITFEIPQVKAGSYEFILSNANGEELKFGYTHDKKQFFLDRQRSGITNFHEDFGKEPSVAPRISDSDTLKVQVILDKTSIELFFDEGATVMTEIFFPTVPYNMFEARGDESFAIEDLNIHEIEIDKTKRSDQ